MTNMQSIPDQVLENVLERKTRGWRGRSCSKRPCIFSPKHPAPLLVHCGLKARKDFSSRSKTVAHIILSELGSILLIQFKFFLMRLCAGIYVILLFMINGKLWWGFSYSFFLVRDVSLRILWAQM
jgi:hypothetical protein